MTSLRSPYKIRGIKDLRASFIARNSLTEGLELDWNYSGTHSTGRKKLAQECLIEPWLWKLEVQQFKKA